MQDQKEYIFSLNQYRKRLLEEFIILGCIKINTVYEIEYCIGYYLIRQSESEYYITNIRRQLKDRNISVDIENDKINITINYEES